MPDPYWITSGLILVAARITAYRNTHITISKPKFRYNSTPQKRQLTMRIPLRSALL